MSTSTAIELPKTPKDDDYEDYVCAFLQAGGLYVERKVIQREDAELLELDILTTDFQQNSTENNLIEIKGGNWGFSDIFKIRGWLTYLNYMKGSFIVQRVEHDFAFFKKKAEQLDIDLIDNSDLSKTKDVLNHLFKLPIDDNIVETIRFSYLLERKQLKQLKLLKKKNKTIKSYEALDKYYFIINSDSFFTEDPIARINKLTDSYNKYRNITAKICHELNGGDFDDDITQLSSKCYKETFYTADNNILQFSLYVEHLARVTILKCVIEHLIDKLQGNYKANRLNEAFRYINIPSSITDGIRSIINDEYFYLYPRFWQFFTYVFGGFILTDLKDKEYNILSEKTGIPLDKLPEAFACFQKLFPKDSWLFKFPNSSIEWHDFFPVAFSGIGANYRKMIYTEDENYESLEKLFVQKNTMKDLIKWNNLAYKILK